MLLKAGGFYARSATPAASTTSRRGWQGPVPVYAALIEGDEPGN
jgi:hypothetical protein